MELGTPERVKALTHCVVITVTFTDRRCHGVEQQLQQSLAARHGTGGNLCTGDIKSALLCVLGLPQQPAGILLQGVKLQHSVKQSMSLKTKLGRV